MTKNEKLWQTYTHQLQTFIQSRVSDPVVAEDIRQNVFLKILERIDTLREHDKLQSWMFQIARNAIIDHYRLQKSTQTLPTDLTADMSESSPKTRQEMASWLLPLIAQLPNTYRSPVRLSEIEGWTHQQVADHLNISLSAAKSRVRRGKLLMKDALTDCCRFEFDQRGRVIDYEPRTDGHLHCNC